jgi:CubicO group peptidase (beta-lactamase class C family)
MDNQLPRSTPEAQGIASSAILAFVEAVDSEIQELHSFMLVRHGQVVAEGWWSPYAPKYPHMLFSLSKSFTSSAIGLAVTEGRLSIDDPVVSFFPDDLPAGVTPKLAAMRVRHLLSMSTGHDEDTTDHLRRGLDGNWIKAFLECPVVYEPGTHFLYNSGATFMLSAIIQKLTGRKLLDYLRPRLLAPLGIEDATWEENRQGINTGGWGMNIKTEDIARFGQMYLQKGLWQGQRILPESWIDLATSRQIDNGSDPLNDWNQGYAFQFWRCQHNVYRGDGAFGQYCIVMPDQDAVLAITSGVSDMQAVLNQLWKHLLPAMGESPLPADTAAQAALMRKLSGLALLPPAGAKSSSTAAQVTGRTYAVEINNLPIASITLEFGASQGCITTRIANTDYPIAFEYGAWHQGTSKLFFGIPPVLTQTSILASGVWSANDTFTLTMRFYLTPYFQTITFHFEKDRLTIDLAVNVSFIPVNILLNAQAV